MTPAQLEELQAVRPGPWELKSNGVAEMTVDGVFYEAEVAWFWSRCIEALGERGCGSTFAEADANLRERCRQQAAPYLAVLAGVPR